MPDPPQLNYTAPSGQPGLRQSLLAWRLVVYGVQLALVAILYVLVARAVARVDTVQEEYRVLWPQAGVALWSMLLFGLRCWPAVLGASLFLTLRGHYGAPVAVMFAAGNTLGPMLAATLMKHAGGFSARMGRVSDIHALITFGGFVGPAISASMATLALAYHLPISAEVAWTFGWRRWLGLGISNVVVTPFLLSWSYLPSLRWPLVRLGEVGLLVALLVSLGVAGFVTRQTLGIWDYPATYAPFPFLIWAALRFGNRGAATVTTLVAGVAIMATSRGFGLFARAEEGDRLLVLQIYLLMLSFTGLYLSAAVAERRTVTERLRKTTELLRALSARIEQAREDERARISREIHDELGQQLTGLKMSLHTLVKRLPETDAATDGKARNLAALIDDAVATVRRIATDLRPGMLDDLGITASLQWQAQEFERRSGIVARFQGPAEDPPLASCQRTALFRILQEALTNVARHAQALHVSIRLSTDANDSCVVLEIVDDGVGMPAEMRSGGLGLVGMRERAELLGGTLTIRSAHEHSERPGTVIEAQIPLRLREENL